MKSFLTAAIACAAALGTWGCLDLTPSVLIRQSDAKPREAQCLACLEASRVPGPGCGDLLAGCRAEPACHAELDCTNRIGHCYGGTRDDVASCAQQCLKNGYFMNGMDPALLASSRFYDCIVAGPCSTPCFGSSTADDAGPSEDSATPPDASDAGVATGGACLSNDDRAITSSSALNDAPKTCGTQCFGSAEPDCAQLCVAKSTGLSAGCSRCWGDVINCGIKECLSPCFAGGQACTDCTAEKCDPAFKACAGTP